MIELPEGTTQVLDRVDYLWTLDVVKGDMWHSTDLSTPRTWKTLAETRSPLRPVGQPLSAPEPPMSEPTEQFATVEIPGNGRAYRWAPNGHHSQYAWLWIELDGGIHGINSWESLIEKSGINPRPVDEPALTLDAVLALIGEWQCADIATCANQSCRDFDAFVRTFNARFGGTR